MLDVHKLRVLREVAAQGSFSGAAQQLFFSPSAVSQHIAALEEHVGTQLLIRGARGVRLTDAGKLLVRHADAILRRLDDLDSELAALLAVRAGRLRLASFASVGATLLPQAIAAFRAAHPGSEISLIDADPELGVDALRRGDVDLAVVFNYNVLELFDPGNAELVELLVEPLRAVMPAGHPLAASVEPIGLHELSGEAWIQCHSVPCRLLLERAAREAGFTPAVAFHTDDYPTAIALVESGVGVALLPAIALMTLPERVHVRPLATPRLTRHVLAAVPVRGERSPAVEEMLELLHRAADGYAPMFARELAAGDRRAVRAAGPAAAAA